MPLTATMYEVADIVKEDKLSKKEILSVVETTSNLDPILDTILDLPFLLTQNHQPLLLYLNTLIHPFMKQLYL